MHPLKTSLLAALLVGTSLTARAALTFSDATLALANYNQIQFKSDPSVGIAITSLAAGGNPGAALDILFSNQGGAISMSSFQGFIATGFGYDPSAQGALTSLAYSNDRYVSVGSELAGLNTVTRSLLLQGGHYYLATIADPAAQPRDTWFTTSASGLASSNYIGFDFATGLSDASLHPDFSTAGSQIAFGFVNRLFFDTGGQAVNLHADFRFDNIAYDLQAAAVPEPQTWALMILALPMLGALRRRRTAA